MTELLFGIVIGLLIAVLAMTVVIYFRAPLERELKQTFSANKKKGAILEPNDFMEYLKQEFAEPSEEQKDEI